MLVTASLAFAQGAQYAKNKALHLASMKGSAKDVKAELAAGSDVNDRSAGGMSALMYTAAFNADLAVMQALFDAGTLMGG